MAMAPERLGSLRPIPGDLSPLRIDEQLVRKMLVAFGIIQASTHVAYLWIAFAGKNLVVFGVAIFIENLSFAMATSA